MSLIKTVLYVLFFNKLYNIEIKVYECVRLQNFKQWVLNDQHSRKTLVPWVLFIYYIIYNLNVINITRRMKNWCVKIEDSNHIYKKTKKQKTAIFSVRINFMLHTPVSHNSFSFFPSCF